MHFKESASVLSTICSCTKQNYKKIDELKSVLLQNYKAYVDFIYYEKKRKKKGKACITSNAA